MIKFAWYSVVAALSVLHYLLYHGVTNLHDISHYIISGAAMVRDHANLIYPYSSMNPEGGGTAYGFFQDNSRLIDLGKSYPSRLYSSLFAGFYLLTDSLRFFYAHVVSIIAFMGANLFLFAISTRFFTGLKQALFVLTVSFTPVVASVVHPSNDVIGYFFSVLILWACLCSRLSLLSIGLLIGVFSHFRSQIVFLLPVVTFFLIYIGDRRSWRRIVISIVAGGLASYFFVDFLLNLIVNSTNAAGGGIDFYVKFFLQSFYGPNEIWLIVDRLLRNLVNLSSPNFLYIFFFTGLLGLVARGALLQKGLVISAFMIVFVPLIIFSLDRSSDPHARYYVGAIPFLVLSWFLAMPESKGESIEVGQNGLAITTFALIVVSWLSIYGIPLKNVSSVNVIKNRLEFLDFPGVDVVLANNFAQDDLIITNHALPSGLASLRNFIPLPPFDEFRAGDNREVDGLIFVYANEGVDSFFKPVDWLQKGQLPAEIMDDHGTRFRKVRDIKSRLTNAAGNIEAEVSFVVYRNSDANREKFLDGSGRRIFKTGYLEGLTKLRIDSPSFDDSKAWNGVLSKADPNSVEVLVGPGPNSTNVLSQRFPVEAGESLKITARVSNGREKPSKGRLQVNWLAHDERFLGAAISVFNTTELEQVYSKKIIVPHYAKWGVVYVTPHGKDDVLKYRSMEVLGN